MAYCTSPPAPVSSLCVVKHGSAVAFAGLPTLERRDSRCEAPVYFPPLYEGGEGDQIKRRRLSRKALPRLLAKCRPREARSGGLG